MPYQLTVTEADRESTFVLREGAQIVGSSSEADVRLSHPSVSRRHAALRLTGDRLVVEDLGSTNGTRVGDRRIDGPTPLESGSALVFGSLAAEVREIDSSDLEPAVRFETAAPAPGEGLGPAPDRTTAASGSLKVFTLEKLPRLLDRLEDRPTTVEMAAAVGSALLESLPCTGVEISRRAASSRRAVLFSTAASPTGEAEADAPPEAVSRVERGDFRLEIACRHEVQARGFRELAALVLRLVTLAQRRERPLPRTDGRGAANAPRPPDPPSLTPAVQTLYRDAERVGRGRVSVLVTGESGTGKELLARFLHDASPRADAAFVTLNCAALPRDLLEAELFGVEEGVATGVRERPGKFELAHGATLFLDEIGDMAKETQAKILRVLQEGEVYRLGGRAPRPADVRVVAATNRDLDELIRRGEFRSDLYHRIADWRVELPPLRERGRDVANLAAWFLQREAAELGLRVAGISRAAVDALRAFPWPGNIRQLEREMARAALFLRDGDMLQTRHLQEAIRAAAIGATEPDTLHGKIEALERREIGAALERHEGNLSAVARDLGIARSTLYRRIDELGLQPSPD